MSATTAPASGGMTPGRSRLLAVGILAIVLWTAWLGVARPLLATYGAQERELARTGDLIAEFRRIAAERPALERRRELLQQAEAAQHLTLTAESDGVAAAGLQKIVKAAVEQAGGTLQSTQVKPARPDGGFRRVGLRVQMTGPIEALRQTLLTLEASQPLIYGDSLEIRARQQQRSTGKGVVDDRTLEIRLDLYSLARAPA